MLIVVVVVDAKPKGWEDYLNKTRMDRKRKTDKKKPQQGKTIMNRNGRSSEIFSSPFRWTIYFIFKSFVLKD